ncbi:hypothetical protein ACMD2_02794 [Ananas comosus]|uniref:Uncharacterized protein n=1 Tax=Ananas comosus TaxID=4615 RepID=A0A199V8R5_ANACO|nr:hypothetical protein ACMD2_02794 [Ananas comosus]
MTTKKVKITKRIICTQDLFIFQITPRTSPKGSIVQLKSFPSSSSLYIQSNARSRWGLFFLFIIIIVILIFSIFTTNSITSGDWCGDLM